jgi:hypothetical protein
MLGTGGNTGGPATTRHVLRAAASCDMITVIMMLHSLAGLCPYAALDIRSAGQDLRKSATNKKGEEGRGKHIHIHRDTPHRHTLSHTHTEIDCERGGDEGDRETYGAWGQLQERGREKDFASRYGAQGWEGGRLNCWMKICRLKIPSQAG